MSEVSAIEQEHILPSGPSKAKPKVKTTNVGKKKSIVRAATAADINMVHKRLVEAIDTSPFYSDRFKIFEKQRLDIDYLRALFDLDPYHLMLFVADDEPAGFMITSPQCGSLWLHWSYIFPEKRRASLAMAGFRALVEHWDNGRFHKIATYTKPDNAVTSILTRYKFELTCELENHLFGEDYLLYERKLNKTSQGYDNGVSTPGLKGRIKSYFTSLLSNDR